MDDYYKILKIEPTDDLNDVKRAYRQLCKEYHPDLGGRDSEEKFLKVKNAYEKLKSKEALKKYYEFYKLQESNNDSMLTPVQPKEVEIYEPEYKVEEIKNAKSNKHIVPIVATSIGTFMSAVALIAVVMNALKTNPEEKENNVENKSSVLENQEIQNLPKKEEPAEYILVRDYVIQSNDTLSSLARDAGITVKELKQYNSLYDDLIIDGKHLYIPYKVAKEDLQYYTNTYSIDGWNLYDVAKEVGTTVETLKLLNDEAIEEINGVYVNISNILVLPNFIKKSELNNMKQKTLSPIN